jgi:ubiquinone/menaquinone biosynthesis C-methylase UbiE
MKSAKERVYDNVYGDKEFSYKSPYGVTGFLYRKFSRFEVTRYQVCYDLLPSNKEKLLDVGCGDGDFIFTAKDRFKECYGVDVSSVRIERAKKSSMKVPSGYKLHFIKCDMDEGLPFPEAFFDTVTCIAVLEHVFNPPHEIEEIFRVLKPRGTFIVQVPNIAWIGYRIGLLFGKLPTTGGVYFGGDWEHLHNFTKSILCQLLIEKGFKIQVITCSGIFAKFRKWWLSLLGGDLIVKSVKSFEK